jgi:hypothetical protein
LCKVHPKGQNLHPTVTLPIQVALYLALLSSSIAVKAFGGWPYWVTLPLACIALAGLLSAFALYDEGHKKQVIAILGDKRFDQVYRRLTLPIFVWFWRRLCNPVARKAGLLATLQAALTARLYDRAMLIAVLYPILLPTLFWLAIGKAGQLGAITFLPETMLWDAWPERTFAAAPFVILMLSLVAEKLASASRHRVIRKSAGWLLLIAYAFVALITTAGAAMGLFVSIGLMCAVLVAGTFKGVFKGTFALTVLFACAVAAVSLATLGNLVFGGITMVVAVAGSARLLEWLSKRAIAHYGLALLTIVLPLSWIVMAGNLHWAAGDPSLEITRALFVFFAIFPLVNALFDWVSFAVTLAFMRLGLRRWNPAFMGLADLAAALVLFLALGATLTAVIAGLNQIAGTPFIDLGVVFAQLRENIWDHPWVPMMLFSTALPTFAHFLLALVGAQTLVPGRLRRLAARLIDGAQGSTLTTVFAPLLTGFVFALPFIIVGFIGWALWLYAGGMIIAALGGYLSVLLSLAQTIGAF